jgi:dynein heavy chain 2
MFYFMMILIFSVIRVDCFVIHTSPVKNTIDELIQRLNDVMIQRLREAISDETRSIETFLNNGIDVLNMRPQTHEEIGEAYKKHGELSKNRKNLEPQLDKVDQKNKLLKSVAGEGHDRLFTLHAKMEKFHVMIETHQQTLREQTEMLRKNLNQRIKSFVEDVDKLEARWNQFKPKERDLDDDAKLQDALKLVKDREVEVKELLKQAENFR